MDELKTLRITRVQRIQIGKKVEALVMAILVAKVRADYPSAEAVLTASAKPDGTASVSLTPRPDYLEVVHSECRGVDPETTAETETIVFDQTPEQNERETLGMGPGLARAAAYSSPATPRVPTKQALMYGASKIEQPH